MKIMILAIMMVGVSGTALGNPSDFILRKEVVVRVPDQVLKIVPLQAQCHIPGVAECGIVKPINENRPYKETAF